MNLSISTEKTKPRPVPIKSPRIASLSVTLRCSIRIGKSFMKVLPTSTGEGSIYFGTIPPSERKSHRITKAKREITGASLFVML